MLEKERFLGSGLVTIIYNLIVIVIKKRKRKKGRKKKGRENIYHHHHHLFYFVFMCPDLFLLKLLSYLSL